MAPISSSHGLLNLGAVAAARMRAERLRQEIDSGFIVHEGELESQREDEALQVIWDRSLVNFFEFQGARPANLEEIKRWLTDPSTENERYAIRRLDLSDLQLEAIPPLLSQFPEVIVVDLSHNRIRSIPNFLKTLSKLQHLFLDHNQISSLAVFDLDPFMTRTIFPQLHSLRLSHNQIGRLGGLLDFCNQLQLLDISFNPIIRAPGTGAELVTIRELNIEHTGFTLEEIRDEIVTRAAENVFAISAALGQTRRPAVQQAPNLEDFGASVQRANIARHAAAVRDNQDGGPYLKTVILEHLQSLTLEDKGKFEEKMASCDGEIFSLIPLITLKQAVSSWRELTKENTPQFMHKYLSRLRLIQRHWQRSGSQTNDQTLQRALGSITTALSRDPACIASIQMALKQLQPKEDPEEKTNI